MDHRFHVFYTYKFKLCLLGTGGRGRRSMVSKNKDLVSCRYLSELEDRISPVFNNTLNENFSFLSINEDEKYELKQILKFLLSTDILDEGTKQVDINKVRCFLASPDENLRWKGWLILRVLEDLGEKELSEDIPNNMAISIGVIKLTYEELLKGNTLQDNRIEELHKVLKILNEMESGTRKIRASLESYFAETASFKVSQIDNAVESIKKIINAHKSRNKEESRDIPTYSVAICLGNLEEKLIKSHNSTLNELINFSNKNNIICFYAPEILHKNHFFSQEPEKYVCRTLKEVMEIVDSRLLKLSYMKFSEKYFEAKNKRHLSHGGMILK